jgi:hypothetical protein
VDGARKLGTIRNGHGYRDGDGDGREVEYVDGDERDASACMRSHL